MLGKQPASAHQQAQAASTTFSAHVRPVGSRGAVRSRSPCHQAGARLASSPHARCAPQPCGMQRHWMVVGVCVRSQNPEVPPHGAASRTPASRRQSSACLCPSPQARRKPPGDCRYGRSPVRRRRSVADQRTGADTSCDVLHLCLPHLPDNGADSAGGALCLLVSGPGCGPARAQALPHASAA